MRQDQFLIFNGQEFSATDACFGSNNRSFRYGDGAFESIRLVNGKIPMLRMHIERLFAALSYLQIRFRGEWGLPYFEEQIWHLIRKNKIGDNGRIRLMAFRGEGGWYDPVTNEGEFLLEVFPYSKSGFQLNEKGLKVDIFSDMEKTPNLFSNFKSNNGLIYVMASLFRKEYGLDDCLLINSKTRVIEAINSNIFFVKHGEIYTPPLDEGCVAGVMRAHLLHLLYDIGHEVHETPLSLEDLFTADEMFLTNAIQGIRWVGSYKRHEFKLNLAEKLNAELNRRVNDH